ncbi:MAG: type II toxin-antitoxin system HicB family antitoxin [Dehalococcoidia bacterium]
MLPIANQYSAIIVPAEEGGFWAYRPELPGAHGQGETVEEVREDLAAAIELLLEVIRDEAAAGA